MIRRCVLRCGAAGLAIATLMATATVSAQDAADVIGSLTREETAKVSVFGRSAGEAFLCVKDDDRAEMREDVRTIYNFVAQDMGTDAAFVYAVGVGQGTQSEAASLDCAELLRRWTLARDRVGLTEVGR